MGYSILITGGAGFVGSCLAILLKRDNPEFQVFCLDNLKRRGSELNLDRLKRAGVTFFHGDVRNSEDFEQIPEVNLLIDCAAEPSVMAGYGGSPAYVLNTNLSGTINCLEVARKYKSDFIFLSTSRVYPIDPLSEIDIEEGRTRFLLKKGQRSNIGLSEKGISENFSLEGHRSLYGSTKLASELFLSEYVNMYGIRGVINRCGVLTGPWQMGKVDQGFMVLWIASHIFKKDLSYIGFGGTGKQVRDILHVNDLYSLLRLQMNNFKAHNGQIYNVGGGMDTSVSLLELTLLCAEETSMDCRVREVVENRLGDIPIYITDYSKVEQATGWKPQVGVRQIVSEIANWIRDNKTILTPILS